MTSLTASRSDDDLALVSVLSTLSCVPSLAMAASYTSATPTHSSPSGHSCGMDIQPPSTRRAKPATRSLGFSMEWLLMSRRQKSVQQWRTTPTGGVGQSARQRWRDDLQAPQ